MHESFIARPYDETAPLVEALQVQMCHQSRQVRDLLDRIAAIGIEPYPLTPRPRAYATQVFSTPELLEQILSYLDTADLLRANTVNRSFHSVLLGSQKLERILGLTPQPLDDGTTPYFSPSSFGWRSIVEEERSGPWADLPTSPEGIPFALTWAAADCGSLGQRPQAMLISQPPTLNAAMTSLCCNRALGTLTVSVVSAGLTCGDLKDACRKLLPSHHNCPDAQPLEHD